MRQLLLLLFIFSSFTLAQGQGEANNILTNDLGFLQLVSGNIQAVNFTGVVHNGPPSEALVASDCEGNLLFYFSQRHLKNRLHNIMENGDTINRGHKIGPHAPYMNYATIRMPGNDSLYYVFSALNHFAPLGQKANSSVEYGIVNMLANGGLGRVESKYNLLVDSTSGGFTLIRHANKRWYWLLNYNWHDESIHAYLITELGIFWQSSQFFALPIVGIPAWSGQRNRFFPSPRGDRLVLITNFGNNAFHVFDFDTRTGVLSNQLTLFCNRLINSSDFITSAEFSNNSNKLYVKIYYPYNIFSWPRPGVTQLKLEHWHPDSVYNSAVTFTGLNHDFFLVMPSPDGKIYLRVSNGNGVYHLGCIEQPDLDYPACQVRDTVLFHQPYFAGGPSYHHPFSRFPGHFYLPDRYGISVENFCYGDTTILDLNDYDNLRSINWNFGDGLAVVNTSNDTTPKHVFSRPGTYTVTAYAEYCNRLDTLTKTITILGEPAPSGITDTAFCQGGALGLQLNDTLGQRYLWSDNDTSRNKSITTGGWHWLETSNVCFTRRDSFYVNIHTPPVHGLPSDTSFCAGAVITLSPAPGNYSWVWNDGDMLPKNISTPGSYLLIMDNSCGSFPFAIQVAEREPPLVAIPADTLICEGRVLRVELPELLRTSYQWQDGSGERIRLLSDTGWYEVTATNECGSNSRGFQLSTDDCSCNIYIPNAFSPNGDGLNDRFELQSRCRISQYELAIYNRWGEQLFKSSAITQSWDGYYQGELLPVGEYVYHLYYYREGLGPRQTKGSFRLLR